MKKYGPQPLSFNDIAKLNLSQIVIFSKPPNIIATNISCFTVYLASALILQSYVHTCTKYYCTENTEFQYSSCHSNME